MKSMKNRETLKTVLLAVACIAVIACGILLSKVFFKESGSIVNDQSSTDVITAVDGYAYGQPGDTMRNVFFDFIVNHAETAESYGSLKAENGSQLVIVNLTISNPSRAELPMFDTDFQLIWGSGEEEWEVPVTYYDPSCAEKDMLSGEYTVPSGAAVSGDLVFRVPEDTSGFVIFYEEFFDSGEHGDVYAVELNPDHD